MEGKEDDKKTTARPGPTASPLRLPLHNSDRLRAGGSAGGTTNVSPGFVRVPSAHSNQILVLSERSFRAVMWVTLADI